MVKYNSCDFTDLHMYFCTEVQSNLSIPETLGPNETVLITEVVSCCSLTGSFIHMYIALGPQLPVLIIEVSLFSSVHNNWFDCSAMPSLQGGGIYCISEIDRNCCFSCFIYSCLVCRIYC